MLVGCHIRVAWGYEKTAAYAAELDCEALQIFAKSPQQWEGPSIDPAAAAHFAELRAELGLGPLFTHTAYLINLGSTDDELWRRSILAYADEIARASLLQAAGCITHIGTRFDPDDLERSARRVAEGVCDAFELSGVEPGSILVLLENTAGAGTTFGGTFDELAAVLTQVDSAGVVGAGLCLDTCHAWAAGIDVSSAAAWAALLDTVDGCCGEGRILAVHANDCRFGRGENRDRHEWIGDGSIGNAGFEAMMCEPRLEGVPAVIEMPGEIPVKDEENIGRLKRLRDGCLGAD